MAEIQGDGAPGTAGSESTELETAKEQSLKIDESIRRQSRKYSMPNVSGVEERIEVDRTALEAIINVGSRLNNIQQRSRASLSMMALVHESYKDKQVNKLKN